MIKMKVLCFCLFILATAIASAQTSSIQLNNTPTNSTSSDDIYVIGSKEKAFYSPGSAHFIDKEELETFKYEDVNRVLHKVPGVYIQEEDGLGLRPNIGLRGAHPHRSKKVTLMEDGILVGPAPYSAPAAYYFPSTSRLYSMEVFKGPSSVQYGPNSVGGAINMITKPLWGPGATRESEINLSGGTFNQLRLNNRGQAGAFAWFIEANRKEGDLLKNLPGGSQPDFEQNDVLLKLGYDLSKSAGRSQKVTFKGSFASEDSDETYLGTTPQDFNNSPYQRYEASRNDNFKLQRFALQGSYEVKPVSWLKTKTTLYHHQMKRDWFKFNDLANLQNFRGALSTGVDPSNLAGLLRGERDSIDSREFLKLGSNDRSYFSQGAVFKAGASLDLGPTFHELEVGLRLHRDQVSRNHTESLASMTNGRLVFQPGSLTTTNRNEDTSEAIAFFTQDEIIYGDLSTKVGFRVERVEHSRDPRALGSALQKNSESVFVPGIGFNYSVTPNLVLLAGVNKGVTLVGPGQADDITPEEAINYEAGFRIKAPFEFETIGFYSDYSNLKGTCSFSTGCAEENLDTEFNGGEAEVYGLEAMANHRFNKGPWSFPIRLGYTYTVARFKTSFANSNPEWGPTSGNNIIRVDDPLPYIPQNQVTFGTGVSYKKVALDINLVWKDDMADQAIAEERRQIPSYGIIDTAFSYQYSSKGKAYLRVNNLLDNTYLVSLRPFGARPGAPRTIIAGFNQRF